MSSETNWVKKTYYAKGLDPLGIQAPAIQIYGQLLPGITNVTDRARYYSFYPWMILAYEMQDRDRTYSDLETWIRRSDCLFTMIGIRHRMVAEVQDYNLHERGLVGGDTLRSVVAGLGQGGQVRLSDYAVVEDENPMRYFKNPLGGLKQYYLGTFEGLGLMKAEKKAVANTDVGGKALGGCMDDAVDRVRFTEVIWGDLVTADILDELVGFCSCRLPASTLEHQALLDIFFGLNGAPTAQGLQRRMSLGLILELARAMGQPESRGEGAEMAFGQTAFRGCVYSGALPGGAAWALPPGLEQMRSQWGTYQKHEMLSVAVQCFFLLALKELEEAGQEVFTIEDFMGWFQGQAWVVAAAEAMGGETFGAAHTATQEQLPPLTEWRHVDHEIALATRALVLAGTGGKAEVKTELLTLAGKLLLALAARPGGPGVAYDPLVFPPNYFDLYQVNLEALASCAAGVWSTMPLPQWIAWIAGHWGIEAHIRVALRKLRQGKDTFHVLPTDRGLTVEALPSPTYTSPRFTQAEQILFDLGAMQRVPDSPAVALTAMGEHLWEACHV
jgi:hypothetical protein